MNKSRFLLVLSLVFMLIFTASPVAFAAETTVNNQETSVIADSGEYVTFQKDLNGNYSGVLNLPSSRGVTAVKCTLSRYSGGVSNRYEILIRWAGSSQVANIRASNLTVSDTSYFSPDTYFSQSFFINAGSTKSGYRSIGYCTIPTSVKRVRIKTRGLQCYFNNESTWFSTGELNGTVSVN
jgi:hypothetical protein